MDDRDALFLFAGAFVLMVINNNNRRQAVTAAAAAVAMTPHLPSFDDLRRADFASLAPGVNVRSPGGAFFPSTGVQIFDHYGDVVGVGWAPAP